MRWIYSPSTKLEVKRLYPVQADTAPYELLARRVLKHGKIAIFGDYDTDGVCASLILKYALDEAGIKNAVRLPERSEGYGIKPEHIRELKQQGFNAVITVDNGITAFEAAAEAKKLGLAMIITDHHEPKDKLPEADYIFDPKLYEGSYKDYSGAGVAYLLAREILKVKGKPVSSALAELAGLATVADVVPLDSNNWYIARMGLKYIRENPIQGIRAILENLKIAPQEATGRHLAWAIAPRINACGRMASPKAALDLLLYGKNLEEVEEINKDRLAAVEKYTGLVEDTGAPFGLAVFEDCPAGVLGLVASRSAERYEKPYAVGTIEGNSVKCSVRTYGSLDLMQAFRYASFHVDISYGGHRAACGASFAAKDAIRVGQALSQYAKENPPEPEVRQLDGIIKERPDIEAVQSFDSFEPFGYKNPEPAFLVEGPVTEVKEGPTWRLAVVNGLAGVFVNNTYSVGDTAKFIVSPYLKNGYIKYRLLDEIPEVV